MYVENHHRVRHEVRSLVADIFISEHQQEALSDDESLFLSGRLSESKLLGLLATLEQLYNINFSDLGVENLSSEPDLLTQVDTISNLTACIVSQQERGE